CLKSTANKLARNSNAHHNTAVKTVARPSRLGAWSVRCVGVTLALAFCASAFADPSKEVVLRPQPQRVVKTAKKMCYVVTGDSRIVNKIDDEFEFVEAFEVGKLRWIAGGNECIETSPNECGCSSAQDRLFTEKVGLRLLTKSCFDHARARATNALSPGQGGSFRMPAGILVNCDQTGRTPPSNKFPAHHWAEPFRGHHDNIRILPRNDSAIVN